MGDWKGLSGKELWREKKEGKSEGRRKLGWEGGIGWGKMGDHCLL